MSATPEHPRGEVFLDARGNGRAMRLTWHHEADLVVLSMWRGGTCTGTFRMAREDVNEFIDALVDGLRDAPGVHFGAHAAGRMASAPLPSGPVTGQTVYRDSPEPAASERPSSFTDWAFGDSQSANAS
ncbi:MAG: hypothetical protein M3445_01405 [Actinomycetota bacterium]|nr:hypothetical protein [Actinomycetota bacterium]